MSDFKKLDTFGESLLIEIIREILLSKTGKELIRDDCFYYFMETPDLNNIVVLNSDMFVDTTDAPPQMNYYQMGVKSIIMNLSDIFVKGVEAKAVAVSLGLPKKMCIDDFRNLIEGIVDCCIKFNLEYIGGDINQTKELIINPTMLGLRPNTKIIHRIGAKKGDILMTNGRFGLTGVGFDILINKSGSLQKYRRYHNSIESVLNPTISIKEALILIENGIPTASIDSSDGLIKSLRELMLSNPGIGFEIDFNNNLVEEEVLEYCEKYDLPIDKAIFDAGEEYIHLFVVPKENCRKAMELKKKYDLSLYTIGKVTDDQNVVVLKNNERIKVEFKGFEHLI